MANVHPWFADVTAQASATWTYQFFQQNDVDLASNLTNKPTMYIAETGWPTVSCLEILLSPEKEIKLDPFYIEFHDCSG